MIRGVGKEVTTCELDDGGITVRVAPRTKKGRRRNSPLSVLGKGLLFPPSFQLNEKLPNPSATARFSCCRNTAHELYSGSFK